MERDALASLAHEIRNPLTSIRIDLQRVEEALPAESPLVAPLKRALREVGRLDRVVSGALRVARSGNIACDLVDFTVPLRRAIEVAVSAFEQSGTVLHHDLDTTAPIPVRGDESALEQVFLNLLLNAAQAFDGPGQASVTVTIDAASAQVVVEDSGCGIGPELIGRVFQPFVSNRAGGTGLGLSIARQIVLAHGGTIGLESAPGTGTVVRVRLPLAI